MPAETTTLPFSIADDTLALFFPAADAGSRAPAPWISITGGQFAIMMRSHATAALMLGICAGALLLAAPAPAQSPPRIIVSAAGAPTTDLPMADYQAFDSFSSEHPDIIAQLSRAPRLMRSQSYLAKHPALSAFLSSHPGVSDALSAHPGNFLPLRADRNGRASDRRGAPVRPHALGTKAEHKSVKADASATNSSGK